MHLSVAESGRDAVIKKEGHEEVNKSEERRWIRTIKLHYKGQTWSH